MLEPSSQIPWIGFFWLDMPWETTGTSQTAAIGFGNGSGDGTVLEGTNAAGLNTAVAFHPIWFDPNLNPIPRVPEPGTLALVSLAVLGIGVRPPPGQLSRITD